MANLSAWSIFLIIIAATIVFGIYFEPMKTVILLAWTLIVAAIFAGGEMIFGARAARS